MDMYAFVGQIVERFGPRSPGSNAERKAQEWVREQFEQMVGTEQVDVQRFKAALTGKFISLKWFVALFLIAMALAWISLPLAGLLGLVNAVIFLGHFVMYRDWLDSIFPQMDSSNVSADIEPVDHAQSTLIIAGHVDSATEFQWWYRFGQAGIIATVLAGFVMVLGGFYLALASLWSPVMGQMSLTAQMPWWILLGLSPLLISMWSIHGDRVVDGAIDNLSGLAIAWGVGRHYANPDASGHSRLKRTRIRLMSFGSEECGLKGSRAYVREFEQELRAENAVLLNMESFKDDQFINILSSETFTGARYPKELNAMLAESMQACGMKFKSGPLMVGATDSSSFANRGLPATCVIGLNSEKLDPTYHTRLDNMENLQSSGMEAMLKVLVHFIDRWDAMEQPPKLFK